jgi:DnaK suppressor protein
MITKVTNITARETKPRKAALESKLEELLGVSPEREELQIEHLADPIDQVRSSVDRDLAIQRIDHQAHLIHDIRSALTKIEDGTYGVCEECEALIPRKRLDAVPWARLCASCQSEREAAGHDGETSFRHAA